MPSYGPRQALLDAILRELKSRQEVLEIHAFGSAVSKTEDEYSDYDLVVCSASPRKTQCNLNRTLEAAAPILGSFVLLSRPDQLGTMFLFKGFSPYHKLDLALVPSLAALPTYGPFRCLYKADEAHQMSAEEDTLEEHATGHPFVNQVNGVVFCIPRFTKCLFRQDRDVYKKWIFVLEHTLSIMHESHFGWKEEQGDFLSSPERDALYKEVGTGAASSLDLMMPTPSAFDLGSSFAACIGQFVSCANRKAAALGVSLEQETIVYLVSFLQSELDRFGANGPAVWGENVT